MRIKGNSKLVVLLFVITLLLASCSMEKEREKSHESQMEHWPNAIFYQIFMRSFADSDGDGIGDLNGITGKLDYLQELGIEALWLTPIHPSPTYHKYDVVDYTSIDPEYGTMEDFHRFIAEAHARDIRVIIDLVINHTSSQNPWFIEALASPQSPFRNWYIWADDATNVNELGEWGQRVWHGSGENQYYAVFDVGMPDLNFDEPAVRAELIRIGKKWLELGVDGFRLDAIKHVYPDHEKEKNHLWWEEFGTAMREVKSDVLLVGEVWAPAAVVAPYLRGIDSGFNFDLAEKLIASVRAGEDMGIVSSLKRTREYFAQVNPHYIDSIMLTNHDMDRVMSQLGEDEQRARMAAALLLTLPGNPFIYYGEEIGMQGKKPDEYIREPFIWGADDPARTRWIVAKYNRDGRITSLADQLEEEKSLYQHYKKLIKLRKSSHLLRSGEIDSSKIRERGIVAFKRFDEQGELLVMHNIRDSLIVLKLSKEEWIYTKRYYESHEEIQIENQGDQVTITLPPYSTLIMQP